MLSCCMDINVLIYQSVYTKDRLFILTEMYGKMNYFAPV